MVTGVGMGLVFGAAAEHRYLRRGTARRGDSLGERQHRAAARRLDRHRLARHDRGRCHDRLPGWPYFRPPARAGGSAVRAHLAALHGYTTVFWWCAGIFAVGAVICGALLRARPAGPGRRGRPRPGAVPAGHGSDDRELPFVLRRAGRVLGRLEPRPVGKKDFNTPIGHRHYGPSQIRSPAGPRGELSGRRLTTSGTRVMVNAPDRSIDRVRLPSGGPGSPSPNCPATPAARS